MKREVVEVLLAAAQGAGPADPVFGEELFGVEAPTLAALCRRWLAVEDAASGEAVEVGDDETGQPRVLIHSTRDDLMRGPPLAFRRVRLVPEAGQGVGK